MNAISKPNRLETPKKGGKYTTRQLLTQLTLEDSPFLVISPRDDLDFGSSYFVDGYRQVPGSLNTSTLQSSHLSDEQLLENSAFAELQWEYVRTTSEWIPVFKYVGRSEELSSLVRVEFSVDDFELIRSRLGSIWLQPNYTPRRPQYHACQGNEELFILDNLMESKEANLEMAAAKGFHYRVRVLEKIYCQYEGIKKAQRSYYRHYKRVEDAEVFLQKYSDPDTWVETFDSYDLHRTVTKA